MSGKAIALVTGALEAGGLETALFAVGRSLLQAGHRPHLVTTRAPGAWFDRAADHGLPATFLSPGYEAGVRATLSHVRRVAARLSGFDGVLLAHAHDAQAGVGLLPRAMPVVSVLQCDVDEVYDVGLANAAGLSAVVAVSGAIAARARGRVGSRTPVVCIPNFTDVADSLPAGRERSGGVLALLFVGRLVPHKGVKRLVPVLGRLRAQGIDARLTVLGDGPERACIEQAAEAAGLSAFVTLSGLVPPAAVRAAMREADVLFLPSRAEGLPLVVVEAMAEGLVPVVSRLPVMNDLVTHGANGLTFDVDDEPEMVAALCSLTDVERRRALAVAAHDRVLRGFSSEVCGTAWVRLFDDAFAGRLVPARTRRWTWPVHPGPLVPWSDLVPAGVRRLVRPLRRGWQGR
jgi:glycosyltransferase involved in cell wall biosynthesis